MILFCVPDTLLSPRNTALSMIMECYSDEEKSKKQKQNKVLVKVKQDHDIVIRKPLGIGE